MNLKPNTWHIHLPASVIAFTILAMLGCNEDMKFQGRTYRAPFPRTFDTPEAEMQSFALKFQAGTLGSREVTYDAQLGTFKETLSLSVAPPQTIRMQQLSRPRIILEADQGHDGDAVADRFGLRQAGLLDILLVIDNSATMKDYQDNLAPNLSNLIMHAQNTDWRIAVVTTDRSCPRDVISRQEYLADPSSVQTRFERAVKAGIVGDPMERGIEMAIRGLAGDCGASMRPWIRNASKKAVVIVSDEENCGSASNEGCTKPPYVKYTPQDFLEMAPAGTKVYGFLYAPPPVCEDNFYENLPDEYYDLVSMTGGIWRPICQDADAYAQVLREISADVGTIINRVYELQGEPPPGTVRIHIDGNAIAPNLFRIDGRELHLDESLEGDYMDVHYSINPAPRFDRLTLIEQPDVRTLQVFINGKELAASEYSLHPADQEIRWRTPPPDRAHVATTYRRNDPLPNTFSLDAQLELRSLRIMLQGVAINDFHWDPITAEVTLSEPPLDETSIEASFNLPRDYQTTYPLSVVEQGTLESVEVLDGDTGAFVEAGVSGNHLIVARNEVSPNRPIIIRAQVWREGGWKTVITLPEPPIPGSLKVEADTDPEQCQISGDGSTTEIELQCKESGAGTIDIFYNYVESLTQEFPITPYFSSEAIFEVSVNDQPTDDFTLEGKTLTIHSPTLEWDSMVTIRVSPGINSPDE